MTCPTIKMSEIIFLYILAKYFRSGIDRMAVKITFNLDLEIKYAWAIIYWHSILLTIKIQRKISLEI